MPQVPDDVAAAVEQLGLRVAKIIHRTDKTLLAKGLLSEQPVAVKCLLTPDPFWTAKWRHEVHVYRVFADSPPPLRVPRLLYTDNTRLLVLEWLEGRSLDDDRYPQHALSADEIDTVLGCLNAVNQWSAPSGTFEAVFDYPDRFRRYHARGYLTDQDRDALALLLDRTGQPSQLNHGDPLPSNILVSDKLGAALLDWEFTGIFLPGFDLAMLHTQLGASTPAVKEQIDDLIRAAGTEDAFTVNLAAVLTRELRIHHELPDGPPRDRRLPLIEAAWDKARQRLQQLASRRP